MSFLNKRHVPTNTTSYFNQSNQKGSVNNQQLINTTNPINSRLQSLQNSKVKQSNKILYHNPSNSRVVKQKDVSQFSSSYAQNYTIKNTISNQNIQTNLCTKHQNQVLRHLCLQCNQLLCSQCISDHLEGHRQTTNTIPKIQTINRLRKQMGVKIQGILNFMEQNNPKTVLPDLSALKVQAIQKVHQMKCQVIKAFQEWSRILENHILQDLVKMQEIKDLSVEMNNLKQEVVFLNSQLKSPQTNPSVQIVKKIHKIDSQKLQAAYLQMFNKFSKSILRSKFTFNYNWNNLMQSFQKSIELKPLYNDPVKKNQPQNIEGNEQLKNYKLSYQQENLPQNVNNNGYGYNKAQIQKQKYEKLNVIQNKDIFPRTNKLGYQNNYQQPKQVPIYRQTNQQNKLFQIQSIQSLIEPSSSLSQRDKLQNVNNFASKPLNQGQQNKPVQRIFSRQGSGKRLAIFNNQQRNKTDSFKNDNSKQPQIEHQ